MSDLIEREQVEICKEHAEVCLAVSMIVCSLVGLLLGYFQLGCAAGLLLGLLLRQVKRDQIIMVDQ